MAFVITIAQQKGGAGKTMLAANLAAFWAPNFRVALLDIDPQRSLTQWHIIRADSRLAKADIHLSYVAGWRMAAELERLREAHDIVIVDSPPQIETEAKLAIRAADLVLIPLQPSLPDAWATLGTLKLAKAEKREAVTLLNRAPARSALRTQVESHLGKAGASLLAATLGNRAGFANAFAKGLGVTESAPKSQAAAEIAAVAAELRPAS
jgi:chromosome partitioning protein